MPDVFEITAPQLNQSVYVAVASVLEDAKLDVLAGVSYYTLRERPDLTSAQIGDGILKLGDDIDASSPDLQFDHSPNEAIYMSRILPRLLPRISDPDWRAGAKAYISAFLGSYRRQVDPFRQVASIETQFDQFGEVDRFRRDTWANLYGIAASKPAAAEAIDQSRIADTLGVKTSHDAGALLERVPIPSLVDFVAGHTGPDSGLRASLPDLQVAMTQVSAGALRLTGSYVANLFELNIVEQAVKDAGSLENKPGAGKPARQDEEKEKTEFEKAIDKAKEKQKDLDGTLGDIRSSVKGTLIVLAFLAAHSNDPDFAKDIEKFSEITVGVIDVVRKYSKGALTVAEKASKLLNLGTTGFAVISGIGFAAGLVAIGFTIFGILGKKKKPDLDEQILRQVKQISQQIRELRTELNTRFDRIEKQLNAIFESLLEQFALIDFELGEVAGDVEAIQAALFNLDSGLQRLNRNIHTFLEAANRRDLVEAINGFLNFKQRTWQDLDFAGFLQGENEFFSWGFNHSQDPLQAGPGDRNFDDDSLLSELISLPLATNVNFLRELPARRFGLSTLSPVRLANPSDWITAAEAYCQLSEESPAHAANIDADRVQKLSGIGQSIGSSLSAIADNNLFQALANHYLAQFQFVKQALAVAETKFTNNPATGLNGINLFGGANQIPAKHFLDRPQELPRCDGRPFGGGVMTVRIDLRSFDNSQLAPYMIASNLQLDVLDACIAASWRIKSVKPIFGERFNVEFQLIITVRIRYGGATVAEHQFETDKTFTRVLLRSQIDTFNPNTVSEPHSHVDGLKNRLSSFPVTHRLINPKLRIATIAIVESALRLSQRAFYAQVARQVVAAGNDLQIAADRLTGSKLLWQSFILTGLPLSAESNEFLRSLLFGTDAIFAGSDAGGPDSLLDDIQDIYTFFSTREEDPPAANIINDIEQVLNERVQTLLATLADIVSNIQSSGEPEPPELLAPTLLRLSLIQSRPALVPGRVSLTDAGETG